MPAFAAGESGIASSTPPSLLIRKPSDDVRSEDFDTFSAALNASLGFAP